MKMKMNKEVNEDIKVASDPKYREAAKTIDNQVANQANARQEMSRDLTTQSEMIKQRLAMRKKKIDVKYVITIMRRRSIEEQPMPFVT